MLEVYPDRFSDDFEMNKKVVTELADIPSKAVRNKVAGEITRMIKRMKPVPRRDLRLSWKSNKGLLRLFYSLCCMSWFEDIDNWFKRIQRYFEELEREMEEEMERMMRGVTPEEEEGKRGGKVRPRYYYYGFEISIGLMGNRELRSSATLGQRVRGQSLRRILSR